jgi:apolipoprotein N-acyltransferase
MTSAAAVLSGLLFALAFPPFEWAILLPLAPVPWIAALWRETSRFRALVSGFLFGLAFWCASIPWISYVVTHYGGQNAVMGVVCLALLAAILAEWPAIVGWAAVACAPARSTWRIAAIPVLWMATEHARSFVYGGFPWNLTATALYRHPVWLQSASLWGAYGVGGAALATSCLLAASAVRRRLAPLAAAALWVLALGALGAVRLSGPAELSPAISVALLQPNLHEEDRAADAARTYGVVLGEARQAASRGPALIVLPESALPVYWETSVTLRRDLSDLAARGSRVLFNDVETAADGRSYNVARLLGPSGLAEPSYRKVHLVPFGEYVPLPRVFFFVRQVSSEIGAFAAASRPELLVSGDLRLGMGVCYEITYPSLVREEVARGANLLATISNDSWYGKAGAQAQHFAGAVLRSVETGRFLVRAAITGISGIVDDCGRIREELSADRAGILFGDVHPARGATAWVRWGYWIPRGADALAVAVLLWGVVRWIRFRRPNTESPTP